MFVCVLPTEQATPNGLGPGTKARFCHGEPFRGEESAVRHEQGSETSGRAERGQRRITPGAKNSGFDAMRRCDLLRLGWVFFPWKRCGLIFLFCLSFFLPCVFLLGCDVIKSACFFSRTNGCFFFELMADKISSNEPVPKMYPSSLFSKILFPRLPLLI